MNRQLSSQELANVEAAHPVTAEPVKLTRAAKLYRLAELLEMQHIVYLFDRVEHMTQAQKEKTSQTNSAFHIAANDPVFKALGLSSHTIAEGQRFFELSDDELHRMSCNCGGHMSGSDIASRLRSFAERGPISGAARSAVAWAAIYASPLTTLVLGAGCIASVFWMA